MHFSQLHQQSVVVFGRILTIAKPCSNAEQEPGGNRNDNEQGHPPVPTGVQHP